MAVSFDFRRRLGSGYFGEVWEAVETGLDISVALKCIPPDKVINPGNFFQEAQVLKASNHPNIVAVHDTGELKDGRIYVSMEYLSEGSVEDAAQGGILGLTRAQRIMIDVLRGLGYAHMQGVIHRDVKPANIMVGTGGEGKLSDFGLALPDVAGVDLSQLKQYQYMLHLAPEIRGLKDFSPLSDIYAAGVTLYRLINGDAALPQATPQKARRLARQGKFPPRDGYREFIPRGLRRVVNKAMSVRPEDRYGAAEDFRHALERQTLVLDWEEAVGSESVRWKGIEANGNRVFEVVKAREGKGGWFLESRRSIGGKNFRRIGALCVRGLRKRECDKRARQVLQELTTGKAY